ncbi:TIGR01212 family radical SAM protein [Planctomycetales bacterium]|nr:TIGR01212 family radical SAM protein [Planctomycetales bacterium]
MRFTDFLCQKFGGKTVKIAVDAGLSCPNRAAGRGCAWCDNDAFSAAVSPRQSIREQVLAGVARVQRRQPAARNFLVYFQPGSNTFAPVDKLRALYEEALTVDGVVGVAIGTRPDCVDAEKIALLAALARRTFVQIEYGLQSVNDATLAALGRGHTIGDFSAAMRLTRARGIYTVAHLIVGLPGDTLADSVRAAAFLAAEKIDGIKIHNLHLVKNTALAERFLRDPFPLPTLDEYAATVARMLAALPDTVTEQRLCAAPRRRDQLLAPDWCWRGEEVLRRIHQFRVQS